MGGELSVAYLDKEPPVKGALEATTSGLNVLRNYAIPFPIFNWNSIPLKDGLENRFHVGNEVWPVFSQVTSLSLYGRALLRAPLREYSHIRPTWSRKSAGYR
jgi:S-adenosylhomocysteine hydrolase